MRFTQGLMRSVQQNAHGVATSCEDRRRTFAQLQDRVARLAGALSKNGFRSGDKIAILSLNSDYYLEAYLAIAWLGAVVVPANYRWSTAEIAFSLNDAECKALIVDDHHAPQVGELANQCPNLKAYFVTGEFDAASPLIGLEQAISETDPILDAGAGGSDLLGIFYTGGTTGRPKGVMLSHTNLCSSGLSMLAEGVFNEGGTGLHVAPMFHLADMLMTTCLLLRGCSHAILKTFSPESVLAQIAGSRISDVLLVPAMLQAVVDHPGIAEFDKTSLKNILYGASPASESLLRRTLAAFPGVRLTQGYGMTESAALICALPWHQHNLEDGNVSRLRAAGRATFDVNVKIIDAGGHELPRGSIGEIVARGPNVMRGYLHMPEATEETLRGGWLHTGDVGWMDDDGYVFIVDRAKDMIISGGENIFSAEVENAVASHPAVATNAVIGIPHEQMGEAVHVALVLRPGMSVSLEEIQAHCRPLIAGYKLPRSLEILEALPLSGAGKVLKTDLRRSFWEGRDRAVG